MGMTRLTICAATLAALCGAQAAAAPAYVLSTVNLRAGPAITNEILGKIPAGAVLEANNCKDGWCEVIWQGKTGYAVVTALDLSGKPPVRRAAPRQPGSYVVVEPAPVMVGPPVYYYRPYGYYRPWGYRGYWRRW